MNTALTSQYTIAKEEFAKFCKDRTLSDFGKVVQLVHQDGSIFILHNASIWYSGITIQNDNGHEIPRWIGVSTEHNGDLFFHGADLLSWCLV